MRQHLSVEPLSVVILAGVLVAGCVSSYRDAPPLAFTDLDYSSIEGTPWPEKTVVMTELQSLYALATPPQVTYVELNPSGTQTLIFIHGLGSYLKFWRYQLDLFAAQGYRVIALDMVGFGKSDKPASFPYTMEAMADVVRLLASRLEIQQPILVGHSMGGQTALSFAIRYPNQLAGLILTAPAGFETFSRREILWFEAVFSTAFIKSGDAEDVWGSVRRNNFYRWRDEYAWLVEERIRLAHDDAFDAYAYANVKSVQGLADNGFVRENLDKVTVPTLIIHGNRDRLIPNPFLHGGWPEDIMRVGADAIPNAQLITLEGCGHTVQIDCHDDYNASVSEYLSATFPP